MKKLFYLIVVIIVCAVACTSEEMVPTERVRTHGESRLIAKSNHVSLDNVMTLTGAMRKATRAAVGEEDDDFICIVDTDNDTLFYVVNHPGGGWTMYASDKRVPAIVAENEDGRFSLKETEEVMGTWFDAMKEDMKRVQNAEDKDLNFTADEIETNRAYWDAVCYADEFLRAHLMKTRDWPFNPELPFDPNGYYYLDSTYTYTQTIKTIPHLTVTTWHQQYPYNIYCPDKLQSTGKAPAGCVAVAGAQMLYYLHYKIGKPDSIPSTAYCYGNILVHEMYQGNYSSTIWNILAENYHGNYTDGVCVAPLIANVGQRVGMNYGDTVSTASTSNLPANVFVPYGINCQYESINYDTLFSSLLDSMPVIARANTTNGSGHSFIIDGYRSQRVVTVYIYKWHSFQLPHNGIEPFLKADSIALVYSQPTVSIRMNWGYGEEYNTPWYTPTGNWLIGNLTYNYGRHFIHKFRRRDE